MCYAGHVASTRTFDSPYDQMCSSVVELGGTIRLGRHANCWGITVTIPGHDSHCQPRAAGFFFDEIDELSEHAGVVLNWLALRHSTAKE